MFDVKKVYFVEVLGFINGMSKNKGHFYYAKGLVKMIDTKLRKFNLEFIYFNYTNIWIEVILFQNFLLIKRVIQQFFVDMQG